MIDLCSVTLVSILYELVKNLVLALVNLQYEFNAVVRIEVVWDALSPQTRPHARRVQLHHVGLDVSRVRRVLVEISLTHNEAYESTCMCVICKNRTL